MSAPEFKAWPKTPRLFRDMVVTEKIDGTNAAVIIEPRPVSSARTYYDTFPVVPGFDNPEGVIVFHSAAGCVFKALLEGDDQPKGGDA